MSNATFYITNGTGFTYGPMYDVLEARQLAEEICGWVEDENGLRVNFV